MMIGKEFWISLVLLALSAITIAAQAGPVTIATRFGSFQVPAKSLQELSWATVVRQQYDFSCGSAAVATLLTYHYDMPTSEAQVFKWMFRHGDREKIKTYGFSLLDMKNYLDMRGLNTDGFRISLKDFIEIGVPAITLINTAGYKHFVVIKGVDDDKVLIGDPAVGTVVVPKAYFKQQFWTGTVLGARAKLEVAQRHFNNPRDWRAHPDSPLGEGIERSGLNATGALTLPGVIQLRR